MRFKKGGKIEVLKKREMGLGWCPAEIVSGNGHTYYVHYERSTCEDGQPIIERAPRKAIRPCPPLVGGTENWVPGDVVEVFDDDSWKTAKILKVVQAGLCFFVRLLGFSREFRAYASNVRVCQSWVDNQWIIIGKASRGCRDEKSNRPSMGRCYEKPNYERRLPDVPAKVHLGDSHLADKNGLDSQELHKVSSTGMKRKSQLCSTHIETPLGTRKKIRVIEKDDSHQRWAPEHPSLFLEKGQVYDIDLIELISDVVTIPVIASSGAAQLRTSLKVFQKTSAFTALAAGIFHRKKVPILSVKEHLSKQGIEVRM